MPCTRKLGCWLPYWACCEPTCLTLSDLPVFRHVAQPLHAGGLQLHVGVEAPGDGLLDDGLPFLVQQGDEPLLGAHVGPDALVGVVQVPDDGGLFFEGRHPWVFVFPEYVLRFIGRLAVRCLPRHEYLCICSQGSMPRNSSPSHSDTWGDGSIAASDPLGCKYVRHSTALRPFLWFGPDLPVSSSTNDPGSDISGAGGVISCFGYELLCFDSVRRRFTSPDAIHGMVPLSQ